MIKRLTTSLTKPPQILFFVKDSWKRVMSYLFILSFILVIPSIVKFAIHPDMRVEQYEAIGNVLKSDFNIDGEMIVDGVFSTTLVETTTYNYFQFSTSKTALNPYTMTFLFEEDSLVLYVGSMPYTSETYVELGLENYVFDYDSQTELNRLTNAIGQLYNTQRFTTIIQLSAEYIISLLDFLLIILLLALIDGVLIPTQPFKFKTRFKLSIYASTIYIFTELIFILLGVPSLNIISIVVTYIYHIWLYRSIRIFPKGVNINGQNK